MFARRFNWLIIAIWATLSSAWGEELFFEDFESGHLDQWMGRDGPNGPAHQGILTPDPLNPSNTVITFTRLFGGGDAFSRYPIDLANVTSPILTFDYLGLAQAGSYAGDLGGFIGIASEYGFEGSGQDGVVAFWQFGTRPYGDFYGEGFETRQLIDDGHWHTYSINLERWVNDKGWSSVYLMLEDFISSRGVAGDAYFDNIRITADNGSELGFSGLFYDPANSGHGFDINKHKEGLVIFYYGHTASGERLWLISENSQADLVFDQVLKLEMYEIADGSFGVPESGATPWGDLYLEFFNCNAAEALLTGSDGTIEVPLTRLTGLEGISCESAE